MSVHRIPSRFSVPAVLILFRCATGEAQLVKAGWAGLVAEIGSWLAVPFGNGGLSWLPEGPPVEFSVNYLSSAQVTFFTPWPSCSEVAPSMLAGSGLELVPALHVAAPRLRGGRLAVECRNGRLEEDENPPQLVGQVAAIHRRPLPGRDKQALGLVDQDPLVRLRAGGD